MERLVDIVLRRYSYDFRGYSKASLKRRVRTALMQFLDPDFEDFLVRIENDPSVFARLLQYLTVSTTEMFRDPEFFKSFRKDVVPLLKTYPSIRIWIAGCSTGEEFYSFAIILEEEGVLDRTTIYATDINPEALRKTEYGMYSLERAMLYSENYFKAGGQGSLSDYYHADYDSIIFDKNLKRTAVFADHCLVTDNVFAETQFVSCRNVLIYFEKAQQDRALSVVH